jgi:Phage protein (N4 Gp49/phage Sf6 gene 66) family
MSIESDLKLEQKLQELQANAPRLTPQHVYSLITKETFTRLPSQKKLTCELTLKNGYTVTGESSTVSPENFRQEIGEQVSRERATAQIWPLEGYLLQQRLYETALGSSGVSAQQLYTREEVDAWRDDAFRVALELIQRIKLIQDQPGQDFIKGQLDIVNFSIQGLLSKQYEQPWYMSSIVMPTYHGQDVQVVFQLGADGDEYRGYYGLGPEMTTRGGEQPGFHTDDGERMEPMFWSFHNAKFTDL